MPSAVPALSVTPHAMVCTPFASVVVSIVEEPDGAAAVGAAREQRRDVAAELVVRRMPDRHAVDVHHHRRAVERDGIRGWRQRPAEVDVAAARYRPALGRRVDGAERLGRVSVVAGDRLGRRAAMRCPSTSSA